MTLQSGQLTRVLAPGRGAYARRRSNAALAVNQFEFDQTMQVAGMISVVGMLAGDLVVLVQAGRDCGAMANKKPRPNGRDFRAHGRVHPSTDVPLS